MNCRKTVASVGIADEFERAGDQDKAINESLEERIAIVSDTSEGSKIAVDPLRRVGGVQIIGLSATLPNVEEVTSSFLKKSGYAQLLITSNI
jgi:hypothetical protein